MNVDPIEGEFFTTEALSSVTDALVRESIQNSLDAANGSGPVQVRFSLFRDLVEPFQAADVRRRYIEGLSPHLLARHSGLPEVPSPNEALSYMLVEDYGTRGLQGDVTQYDDLDEDVRKNDFFYFWRNIGRTRKELTDLGRWGLGKTVFQAASRINSFFGLTTRADDGRSLLMGQSVLKIHRAGGVRHAPYGYFGLFDDELALPVENPDTLRWFSEVFGVDRMGKPGLSVLIPYPDREIEEIKFESFAAAVIRHYFFPILAGRLAVEIKFESREVRLDQASLDVILGKSRWAERQGLLSLISFARWAIRQPEDALIRLAAPPVGKAPKLREALFAPEVLASARARFADGGRLAFHLPLAVLKAAGGETSQTGFAVFLERDPDLERPEDYFIRHGITIPEVTSLKQKGIRALVSITDPELSAFLGDAENPAHTEWERNSKKFKRKYKLGPTTLDFVKTSPRELTKLLTQPQKGRDENLLRHIFSIPLAPAEGAETPRPGQAESDRKGTGEDRGFLEIEPGKYLQLNPIKGGFRLTRWPKAPKVPRLITLRVAYEVRSGNPFKKYTPFDFDVAGAPITITADGAEVLLAKENAIQIEVHQVDFRLTVTGFDMHRDLRVKTMP
jgi:hypothetical protein